MKPRVQFPSTSLFSLLGLALLLVLLLPCPVAAAPIALLSPTDLTASSPLLIDFTIDCEKVSTVELSLSDQNHTIIARQILDPKCGRQKQKSVTTKLYFDIFEPAPQTTLSLSTRDQYSRLIWLDSQPIKLTKQGAPSSLRFSQEADLMILSPSPGESASGKDLTVKGSIPPTTERFFILELIDEQNWVVTHQAVYLPANQTESVYPFEQTIPLPELRQAAELRLVLAFFDPQTAVYTQLTSVPIQVYPN